MKDTAVVHLTKCAEKTIIASANIAKFIASELELPLVDGPGSFTKDYRNIIYVNSMGAFAHPELRKELSQQARHCENLVYVQNDYNVHPISQVQKVVRDERGWSHDFPFHKGNIFLWGTIPEYLCKPGDVYLNWNQLTWKPLPRVEPISGPYSGSVFYWGAWRPGREDAFARLLYGCYGHEEIPVVISCAKKVQNKFSEIPADYVGSPYNSPTQVDYVKPFRSLEELRQYGCTIYMEDETSNKVYTSPANRFYEALSAGLFMFVDKSAVHTLERAGYEVPKDWIIDTPSDIKKVGIPVPPVHRNQQATLWRTIAEKGYQELRLKLNQAMSSLNYFFRKA